MAGTIFSDFYNDDNYVSPAMREKIEAEVDLIGQMIEEREAKGLPQAQPEETVLLGSLPSHERNE